MLNVDQLSSTQLSHADKHRGVVEKSCTFCV